MFGVSANYSFGISTLIGFGRINYYLVGSLCAGIVEDLMRLARVSPAVLSRIFKQVEVTGPRLSPPLVLRLDGAGFGRILSEAGFSQPRDRRVHNALIAAAEALMKRLSGASAYIVSDEVNILLDSSVPYGGRLFKVVSITASLASAVLTKKLGRELFMDCRPVLLPSTSVWGAYVLWRSRVAANNFLSKLYHSSKGRAVTPSFTVMLEHVKEMLLGKEVWEILGSCIIYEAVEEIRINPVTGGPVKKRRRVLNRFDGPWRCLR